jgi:hypothetical protein
LSWGDAFLPCKNLEVNSNTARATETLDGCGASTFGFVIVGLTDGFCGVGLYLLLTTVFALGVVMLGAAIVRGFAFALGKYILSDAARFDGRVLGK